MGRGTLGGEGAKKFARLFPIVPDLSKQIFVKTGGGEGRRGKQQPKISECIIILYFPPNIERISPIYFYNNIA
jgi:hypothetical protein